MKPFALALVVLLGVVCAAGERQWQTGTWKSAGAKQDVFVGTPQTRGTLGASTQSARPQVGIYVIETETLRLELQDIVPIETSRVEREFRLDAPVTFALEKNTVYVRTSGGEECRLRVLKKVTKSPKSL